MQGEDERRNDASDGKREPPEGGGVRDSADRDSRESRLDAAENQTRIIELGSAVRGFGRHRGVSSRERR